MNASLGPGLALQTALEPLDLAGRVDDRLLAREERVAVAANVDAKLLLGRPDRPLRAAGRTVHLGLVVLGMHVGLHAGFASTVAGTTRTRFFAFVACSNFTL